MVNQKNIFRDKGFMKLIRKHESNKEKCQICKENDYNPKYSKIGMICESCYNQYYNPDYNNE